jgi:AI-2 transport protein TqsA
MPAFDSRRTTNTLLLILVLFLTVTGLKFAEPVFLAVLLSVLLLYVMDSLVIVLQRRRFPLWLASLISILLFSALFLGLGFLISVEMKRFSRNFPRFQADLIRRAEGVLAAVSSSLGIEIPFNPAEDLRALRLGPMAVTAARSVLQGLSVFLLVFFFSIILLLGKYRAIRTIFKVFPPRRSRIPFVLHQIDKHLRVFLGIKAISSLAVGIGTALLLLAFRLDFAVIWGYLASILNFVPTLGPIASILMPVLFALVQFDGWVQPVVIAAALAAIHLGVSNFIEPKFMGERLNLSFYAIILSLFVWGWLWGAPGVLLAVPLTTSIKIIMENVPATARFAQLMGRAGRGRRGKPDGGENDPPLH